LANDSTIVSLASNQAISMAGQFVIAANALQENPEIDTLLKYMTSMAGASQKSVN
jgi:hypothetical protein